MGSPVSAVMANLVMENLQKRALSTSIVQPCFWKRYVDDVCAAVNSSLVQTLQQHLNNIEPSIQVTVERETNRKISFLDVTVCRQDNDRLSTKVYRKPTHTERYLSFHSHYPDAHKRAVVYYLTDRAKTIPSSSDQRSKEMKHVTAALVANGLLFAHGCMLLTHSITKAKRALCDVAQFFTTAMTRIVVGKSADHVKPHSICFYHNIMDHKINICHDN